MNTQPVPLQKPKSAFQRMIEEYQKWPDLNFWDDLTDHIETGYVRISPTAMGMAKPFRDEKGDYWFIRAAVGNILEIAYMLPWFLPRIKWCRNNDGKIKTYNTERVLRLATRKKA